MIAGLFRLLIALVMVSALAIAWLISTTGGARWIADRVMDQVPALQLTVLDGSILDGFTLGEVQWTDADLDRDLSLQRVVLRWQPACLLDQEICIDTLHLSGISLQSQDQQQTVDTLLADAHFSFEKRTINASLTAWKKDVLLAQGHLHGTQAAHRLELAVRSDELTGGLQFQGGLDEAWVWQGEIAQGGFTSAVGDWTLQGSPALTLVTAEPQVMLGAHCWAGDPLRLCAEPIDVTPEAGRVDVTMDTIPLEVLRPWLPDVVHLSGDLAGAASLSWAAETPPRARVTLDSAAAGVEVMVAEDEPPILLTYRRIVGDVDLSAEQVGVRVGISSSDVGTGGVAVYLNDPLSEAASLSGTVWLDGVDLSPIAGALPVIRAAAGRLRAVGEIGGTLAQPDFKGRLSVEDASVLPADIVNPIEGIDLNVTLEGDVAVIDGKFEAGAGEGVVSGVLGWSEGLVRGAIRVTGEKLEIDQGTLVKLELNPDIAIRLALETISLSGELLIPQARIQLAAPPVAAVRVSRDAVLVDDSGMPLETVVTPERTLQSQITVRLGDDVRFTGFGASGALTGALQFSQVGEATAEAEGVLELVDARYEIYGQRLSIRRGRLIFAGPVTEPRLDIEAVREAVDMTAGVRVTGQPRDPRITLFSSPYMEQASILAYLLTGRPPGEASPSEEALLGQAALSSGVLGGGTIGTALAEQLGIRDFQLEARGQGEQAQVAVSGYIAPNLLVRYGVNMFQPQNTLSMRYYLNPQLYLEAVTGADSAVDVIYSFNYD